jgi:hypothetical protein
VHILYTDAAATHIIVGKIYETKADKDLTEDAPAQAERDQVRARCRSRRR